MSLYIRLNNGFFSHRKTNKLKARLGTDAWWIPVRIWSYAAENQPDGIFDGYSAEELAVAIGYAGDAKEMLQALLDACFMDSEPLAIHNWAEHNGFHAEFADRAKKAAEARWAKDKERRADVLRKKEAKKEDMIRDEMRRDETSIASSNACGMLVACDPSSIPPSLESVKAEFTAKGMPGEAEKFMAFYDSKGWMVGKNKMKSWKGAVAGWVFKAKDSPRLGLASSPAKPVKTMADRLCEDMLR